VAARVTLAEELFAGGLLVGRLVRGLIRDHLAQLCDVLPDMVDALGPGALPGAVRVGKTGGILALGFGEAGEGVFEALLEGGAGHGVRVAMIYVDHEC